MKLSQDDRLGIDVVGIIAPDSPEGADLTGSLGAIQDIEKIVGKYRVQQLILLPGAVTEEKFADLVAMGRRRVLDVTLVTDYVGLVFHQATVSDLSGRPVITYPRDTRYAVDRLAKRLFDILLGVIFLIVSVAFYVVYSLYALSRGVKPFTSSSRLGLEGEPFSVPTAGAGRSDGPSDFVNLPLFWLVVIGKMSIVGPYPLAAEDASKLTRAARFRTEVRPGITGYWRAGTGREVTAEELLVQDANYVRNWSLVQDFKIFLTTFGNMLTGKKRELLVVNNGEDQPHERNPERR